MLLLNGKQANIDEINYMLFHGQSVFTTMLASKTPHFFQEHWTRVSDHAQALGLYLPLKNEVYGQIVNNLTETPRLKKVRIICAQKSYAITIEPFYPLKKEIYEGSQNQVILASIPVHDYLAKYKTSNYLPYTLAQKEALQKGAFEALLLNHQGYVVDGSRFGFFLVRGQKVLVPLGGLESIMRNVALKKLEALGFNIQKKFLKFEELNDGQIFLTNSLNGVIPVGELISKVFNDLVKTNILDQ